MIVQTVSHYKIIERLAEGGMGVVNKAQGLKQSQSAYRTLITDLRLILDQKWPMFAVNIVDNTFLVFWRNWSSRE